MADRDNNSLNQTLEDVGLEAGYWGRILKDELGITTGRQLRFLDDDDLAALDPKARYSWETKALRQLPQLSYESFNQAREETMRQRLEDAERLLNDLQAMQEAGLTKSATMTDEKYEQLKQVFSLPEEQLVKSVKEFTIEDLIEKFKPQLANLETMATNRVKLSASELVEKASGGLALRGILITNNAKECTDLRKRVLEVPEEVKLLAPVSKQTDDVVEFSSRLQADLFRRSLDTMGHSVASSVKGSGWGFQLQAGFSEKHEDETEESKELHGHEVYHFREMFSVVPTAALELNAASLRLSGSVIKEMKKLERLIEGASDKAHVQNLCEEFLYKYGSHINVGTLQFGGIYEWIATYSSAESSLKEDVKSMVRDALNNFVAMSYSNTGYNVGGSVSGDHSKNDSGLSASYEDSELTKTDMHINKKGGPPEIISLPMWKMGLVSHNSTWAVIDRGCSFATDFVGIWEMIHKHREQFMDATCLSNTLRKAWWDMSGMPPSCKPKDNKAIVALDAMNNLVNEVKEWNEQVNPPRRAVSHLQTILNEVEELCFDIGHNKFWVESLRNDKPILQFLLHFTDTEIAPEDVFHVKYLLKKILSLTGNHDFPKKLHLQQWTGSNVEEQYIPSILQDGPIQDTHSLLKAVNDKLLPALQLALVNANGKENAKDRIEVQATVDLALACNSLIKQFEVQDKCYDLFFLLTLLRSLSYSQSRKAFEKILTYDALDIFQEHGHKRLEDFNSYKSRGVMQLQAYLLHLSASETFSSEQPQLKEEVFAEALKGILDLLVHEVSSTLTKYAASSPFQWQQLLDTLEMLKDGNAAALEIPEVNIVDLESLMSVEVNNTRPEQSSADTSTLDEKVQRLLDKLGLLPYYPSKITLQDVMAIRKQSQERSGDLMHHLPWAILMKLIMLDYSARDSEFGNMSESMEAESEAADEMEEEMNSIDELIASFGSGDAATDMLNPLDTFLVIYECCDLMLRQAVVQKMHLCRLAVPFIYSQISRQNIVYSLWPLRSVVVDWRNEDSLACETSVVHHPTHIVSFIRLGRPSQSKSVLLNHVLGIQGHHTFWNKDSPQGHSSRIIANGFIEAAWYIPSGNQSDSFNNLTMLLNLRGDACEHQRELVLLQELSHVIVVMVDIADLEEPSVLQIMKTLHGSSVKLVLLLVSRNVSTMNSHIVRTHLQNYIDAVGKGNMANMKQLSGFKGNQDKSADVVKHEVSTAIAKQLYRQTGRSIEESVEIAEQNGAVIDEYSPCCLKGKALAEEVLISMADLSEDMAIGSWKEKMLPLQGDNWHSWSKLLKSKQRSSGKDMKCASVYEMASIQQTMTQLRQQQLKVCSNLSPLIKTFIRHLIQNVNDPTIMFFLQWLKLTLDEKSRQTLPALYHQYHKVWATFTQAKQDPNNHQIDNLKNDLNAAEEQLAKASVGLEHLFRELSQIFEAAMESNMQLKLTTKQSIQQLPEVAAKLLLLGQPMEIMDGDTSSVPLTWVKAVFSSLRKLAGDKKLFVISVLGVQSSGKSTLLNTMFGLQFAVSAGRCTRGVYMQLVKTDKNNGRLPYDYVMVIDTEGLRAPELSQLKHDHDNELATLVIGLGDVTIMNIKGENVAEVKDVLQIAVHAFLRMNIVNRNFQMHRTCVFIHQNVPAINAREKMMHGCQKLQENLDEMTKEACAIENIADIHTFNQVIDFNGHRHVWYFSDLWRGDPPMAPVNTGYSLKVEEVRSCLLEEIAQRQCTFLTFSDMLLRIEDLWKGVLAEDFVFSFRNSLAAKAYNSLEGKYYELSWALETHVMEWFTKKASPDLERCTTAKALDVCYGQLVNTLNGEVTGKFEEVRAELEKFFERSNLRDILVQWEAEKVLSLRNDAKEFENRAKQALQQKQDALRVDILQNSSQEEHESEIMKKAKDLADGLCGKAISDHDLRNSFDEMWIQWMNQLAARAPVPQVPIEVLVESVLWHRLPKDGPALRKELNTHPLTMGLPVDKLEGSITVADIKKDHLSVRTSMTEDIKSFFAGKDPWLQCRHTAVVALNAILRKVDVYLTDLRKQDSKFHVSYATYVVKIITDDVKDHNLQYSQQYPFTLLPNLMVRLVVHTCRYAVGVFKEMEEEYEKHHGRKTKLESYKNAAWTLFKNTVNQSTKEVTAADLLFDRIEELLKKTVRREIPIRIVDEILFHFGHKKYNLILAILDDLANKGNFSSYRAFLYSAKEFALDWVTSFIHNWFFSVDESSLSPYAVHAQHKIKVIVRDIEASIKIATEEAMQQTSSRTVTWVKSFCNKLNTLPITESDLKHATEQNVGDFYNLERLLLDRLLAVEERVMETFKVETAESIRWEGTTPYRRVMDKLWGCEAQCPFCNEPCQRTDPKHAEKNDSHQCIQHRPSGVGGDRWDELHRKDKLVIETCNYQVQSKGLRFNCRDCKFECRKSGQCPKVGTDWMYHDQLQYKTFLPHWDIPPNADNSSSKYWMWFMATYQYQLKDMYNAQLPDVPDSWLSITKDQAKESLRVYMN